MVEFVELTDARQPACKANMKVANEKKQSIRKARQTTLLTPMLTEAFKRAKLRVKQGEVEGTLSFTVKPDSLQELGELEAPVRKRCLGVSRDLIHLVLTMIQLIAELLKRAIKQQ